MCVCIFIFRKRMAEEAHARGKHEKSKMNVVPFQVTKKNHCRSSSSLPTSPVALRKSGSTRYSCLCSPTTHAGSFRCRHHRNEGLSHNSISVGSKLSELTTKIWRNLTAQIGLPLSYYSGLAYCYSLYIIQFINHVHILQIPKFFISDFCCIIIFYI